MNRVMKAVQGVKVDCARKDREDTIAEVIRYFCKQDPRLRKASDHMLMHLCRLADNHYCATYGSYIVERGNTGLSWEYNVGTEVQLFEARKLRPVKGNGVRWRQWHTAPASLKSMDLALRYYDCFMRG